MSNAKLYLIWTYGQVITKILFHIKINMHRSINFLDFHDIRHDVMSPTVAN